MPKNPRRVRRSRRFHGRKYNKNVRPPATLWAAKFGPVAFGHISADEDPARIIVSEGRTDEKLLIGEYKLVRTIRGKLTVETK